MINQETDNTAPTWESVSQQFASILRSEYARGYAEGTADAKERLTTVTTDYQTFTLPMIKAAFVETVSVAGENEVTIALYKEFLSHLLPPGAAERI